MRITHANGVATLALVLAAGGAYAAASSAIAEPKGIGAWPATCTERPQANAVTTRLRAR